MKLSFQKYSDPNWGYWRSFAGCYVPDEIFEPVLDALKETASQTLKHAETINQANRRIVTEQKWGWPETLNFVADCWMDVDPAYSAKIKGAFDNDCLRIADVMPGRGGGRCPGDYIEFERDGTLNDPVYMAHETGHLMAILMALGKEDPHPQSNIAEIQAFFMQEKSYDHLIKQADTPEEGRAIRLHRLADYTSCLSCIPFCVWIMNQQKGNIEETDTLRSSFAAWAIEDERSLARCQQWLEDDNKPVAFKAQMLHSHPFATLITADLYKRYLAAAPDTQKHMIKTLYEGGFETSLQDVLSAFGIQTQTDLREAATNTLSNFSKEILQLGLIKNCDAGLPKPAVA